VRTRAGRADADGVQIFYEDLGDPRDPAVLLIAGLAAQLPMWPDGFCALLVEAGYRVIPYQPFFRRAGVFAHRHSANGVQLRTLATGPARRFGRLQQ
jgi:pimeloyl-ACP methyl ester carboxylesterase